MSGHTRGPWQTLPEECDRPYIRVRGTALGHRYKVANVLTPVHEGVASREADETRANARLIAAAPTGLEAAEEVYLALLRHPHDTWRLDNQRALCLLRDFIATATGRTERDVQEEYEEKALLTSSGAAP